MSRSRDGTWLTTRSPIFSTPCVISSRPATIRSAVVLPQPEGPTRTMNSPSLISRLSELTAVVPSGYVFVTPSNVTPAIPSPPASVDRGSYQMLKGLGGRVADRRLRRVGRMDRNRLVRRRRDVRLTSKEPPPDVETAHHAGGHEREADRPVGEADCRLVGELFPLAGVVLVRRRVGCGDEVDAELEPLGVVPCPGIELVRHRNCLDDPGEADDVPASPDSRANPADQHDHERRHERPEPDPRLRRVGRVVPERYQLVLAVPLHDPRLLLGERGAHERREEEGDRDEGRDRQRPFPAGRRQMEPFAHASCSASSTRERNCRVRGSRGSLKICSGGPSSRIRPASRKQTLFETSRAKPISCVARNIVIPLSASSRTRASTSETSCGSSALVISSSSISFGCIARARTIATRCCWPPLSRSGNSSAFSSSPIRWRSARARCSHSSREIPSALRGASITFCNTVMCGKRLYAWKTIPIFLRSSLTLTPPLVMHVPSTVMSPSSTCSSRLRQRSSVDLPEPEAPIRPTTWCSGISRAILSSTWSSPNHFETPRISTNGRALPLALKTPARAL